MKVLIAFNFLLLFYLTSCRSDSKDTAKSSIRGSGQFWEGIGSVQVQPVQPSSVFSDWDTLNSKSTVYCVRVRVQQLDGSAKSSRGYVPQKFCLLANNDTIVPFEVIQESVLDANDDRFTLAFEIPKGSAIESIIYTDSIMNVIQNLNYLQ